MEEKKTDINIGLTSEEVLLKIKNGEVNKKNKFKGKSHLKIFMESFFTFFNIILYVLAIIFIVVIAIYPEAKQFITITKFGFLFIILFNALSSIITQEASKRTLEKMRLIADPKVKVLRDSKIQEINVEELVLDDIAILSRGNEIPADMKVVEGEVLVNESNLTGESTPQVKKVGAEVLSGSYVISGKAKCQALKVGNDTYLSKVEQKISSIKKKKSALMEDIYNVIKVLVFILIPLVIAVFIKTFYIGKDGTHWVLTFDCLTKSATTLVGMIPIGMILLATITLSKSIITLSKKNTMIQELYAIENLSEVDTLCLDKTGTLTTQKFTLEKIVKLDKNIDLDLIISSYYQAMNERNETLNAIARDFKTKDLLTVKNTEEFNSETKCSSVTFTNGDTYKLGAPDFIFKDEKLLEEITNLSKDGYRILGLLKNDQPIAYFMLKDELQKGVKDTLLFFSRLGVDIKIISGDNVLTVKEIAREAGVINSDKYISMENVKFEDIYDICDKYTIFGRTSPDQKQEIIRCLQLKNKVVGYIGDGVNDTQSLRQADCSIALKDGADSTKAVSDVILLDNNFANLPAVLKEGRRVVINIKRSVLLFLTKSFYIATFSFISLFLKEGLVIEIEAIYLYEFISIALCGFLLSIQNNEPKKVEGDFIKTTIPKAFGYGLFMAFSGFIPMIVNSFYPLDNLIPLICIFSTIAGLIILVKIARPLNRYTINVIIVGFVLTILLALMFPDVFFVPGYLASASGFVGQLEMLAKAFFNMTLFMNFKYYEWILIAVYACLAYFILWGIDHLIAYLVKLETNLIAKIRAKKASK